jgi:DedD protein
MKWAFWRRRKPRASGPGRTDPRQGSSGVRSEETVSDEAGVRADQAAQLRVRMRRRLIGAAALLLGTAVVVPMMLDRAPRPLPDNIPIDIPSERTPFAPRLSLPASAPGASEGKPASAAGGAAAGKPASESGAAADKPAESHSAKEGEAATVPGAKTESREQAPSGAPAAPPAPSGSGDSPAAAPPGAEAGRWFVQAAALSSESAAGQLSQRLSKAGMTAFVERAGSAGAVVYRVRLGPFASREAAVKARRHLHAMGVGSNVVRVEQAQR